MGVFCNITSEVASSAVMWQNLPEFCKKTATSRGSSNLTDEAVRFANSKRMLPKNHQLSTKFSKISRIIR